MAKNLIILTSYLTEFLEKSNFDIVYSFWFEAERKYKTISVLSINLFWQEWHLTIFFNFVTLLRLLFDLLTILITSMYMAVTILSFIQHLKNLLGIIKMLSLQRSIKGPAVWPKPKILILWLQLPQFLGRRLMFVILKFHNIALL